MDDDKCPYGRWCDYTCCACTCECHDMDPPIHQPAKENDMSKQTFRVVEMTLVPGQEKPETKTVKANLSKGKAKEMRDSMQEKVGDFEPNAPIVSYLVQPA